MPSPPLPLAVIVLMRAMARGEPAGRDLRLIYGAAAQLQARGNWKLAADVQAIGDRELARRCPAPDA